MRICSNVHDDPKETLELMLTYAWQFIGTVYVWGGKELKADRGYDCSGYVQECLEAAGVVRSGVNNAMSSLQLYHRLSTHSVRRTVLPKPGDLLFFGRDLNSINHIAIALSTTHMIEAGGGSDKQMTTGMVRVRPIRADLIATLNTLELLEKKVRL